MSQPPYPPQGGSEPGGDQSGSQGWNPPDGANDPTQQLGSPGGVQREPTQEFPQPQYAQPQYGQPQYGQQLGQPQYGQPTYGQPPYGQPGPWGPGPGGQQPKGNKNNLIALIIAGVVVLAAIGVALFLLFGTKDQATTASSATAPSTTRSSPPPSSSSPSASSSSPSSSSGAGGGIPAGSVPPNGLGGDPILNGLAQSCYDGDMNACDTLYNDSQVGSTYETYGGTCAGRQAIGNSDVVYCTDAFPG